MYEVPFNRHAVFGDELVYINDAIQRRHIHGDGHYTEASTRLIRDYTGANAVLLTHSCTAALELAALLLDLGPGDEVIMPSFTFSSTANAVVLRGAKPVFVDVYKGTMNLNEDLIEALISPATKAIMVVHYAGRVPDMDRINRVANAYGIPVIEDAAQSYGSSYRDRPAGTNSALAALSFHATKNIAAGEGGALIINDPKFVTRATILREKGTNRVQFLQGQTDKYTWMDVGSSYLPSELNAAFLLAQLQHAGLITAKRRRLWNRYHANFAQFSTNLGVSLPDPPSAEQSINGHIFHVLLPDARIRPQFLQEMKIKGIQCTFHYVPLHSSPAGMKAGSAPLGCPETDDAAARLVRLPLYFDLTEEEVDKICDCAHQVLVELSN